MDIWECHIVKCKDDLVVDTSVNTVSHPASSGINIDVHPDKNAGKPETGMPIKVDREPLPVV